MHIFIIIIIIIIIIIFRIIFPDERISIGAKRKLSDDESKPVLTVQPFVIENRGPYPYNVPKK